MNRFLDRIAYFLRVVCVPPILALFMLLCVAWSEELPTWVLVLSILFLTVVPVLAYPMQPLVPGFRDRGREGQRNLAFIFTVVGYALGAACVLLLPMGAQAREIFLSYFVSGLLLFALNKLLKIRASGHGAGVTGALIFPVRFGGLLFAPGCVLLYALILWSSVRLRRHTVLEFVLGTVTCFIGYAIAWGIFGF